MKPPQTSSQQDLVLGCRKELAAGNRGGKKKTKTKKTCVISTRSQNRRTKLFDSDQPPRLFKNAKYEAGCLTLCFAFKGARRWTHHLPPQRAASSARWKSFACFALFSLRLSTFFSPLLSAFSKLFSRPHILVLLTPYDDFYMFYKPAAAFKKKK